MSGNITSSGVKSVFTDEVSTSYEKVNHLLTFGFDILWRRRAAKIAASAGGSRWADMCTGTGETAVYLSRLAPEGTTVYGVDFSEPMLNQARRKSGASEIIFRVGNVNELPFPDNSLDLITISFATRNINLNRTALTNTFREFRRVLRPGGRFVNLETSQPSSRLLRYLFHTFIKLYVKPLGGTVSGSYHAYAYLSHTIPRFYSACELTSIIEDAGFKEVKHKPLLFSIAAIHQSIK